MTSPKMEALEPRQFLSAAAPNVSASTPRLIFSQTKGAVSAPQWVTLTNTGGLPLALQSVSISGADAGHFAVSRRRLPAALAPGASTALKVSFAPSAAAVSGAFLEIATDDPDRP